MGYTALYRKFRPQTFSEMVGQEHITRTLKNQIISGRVGHAYLLNGGRGTGKTSTAKILARAINCLNPQDGNPCNECEICKSALNGSLTDIVEMEAASNNSVEDIRSIREEVNFLPTKAKYRVYIIDEVHMLSQGAFNALLKTLEEPPEYVTIILICSNEDNMLSTIKSRCTRIHFENLEISEVKEYIKQNYPEIEIDDSIINLSQGSIGKALKLNENKTLYENIENILKSFKNKDVIDIVKMSEEIYKAKEEIYSVLEYMNVLLLKLSKEDLRYINAIDIVEETKKRLKANSNYDMCIDNLLFNINYLFRK